MQNNINLFCLVSRQAMANVLPVLMIKPRSVTLVCTNEERHIAQNLEKLFRKKNIILNEPINTDAFHFITISEAIRSALNKTKNDEQVMLNVTGGTKPMAFAAYDNFKDKGFSIVYCDTEHKKLLQFFPEYSEMNLNVDLSIEDYFSAYGYEIRNETPYSEIQEFNQFFNAFTPSRLSEFMKFCKILRKGFNEMKPQETKFSKSRSFIFHKNYDKYSIRSEKKQIPAIHFDSVNFLSGKWLEFFAYYCLNKKGVTPLKASVKIINNNEIQNEIDCVYLDDYKLHLLSCKTGNFDKNALYELETLRRIAGGIYAQASVITDFAPSKAFSSRARELNISLKTAKELYEK